MEKGFTALELLVTLAISTILLTVATPGLTHYLQQSRSTAAAALLQNQLAKARELAITTGQRATFCGTNDGIHCEKTNFSSTLIFSDTNANNTLDEGEFLLSEDSAGYQGNLFLAVGLRQNIISFKGDGSCNQAGGIYICPQNLEAAQPRKVVVNRAGRSYVLSTANRNQRKVLPKCVSLTSDLIEQ